MLTREGLDEAFLEVIAESTAGSPMDETIKWTNLSRKELQTRLSEKGFVVDVDIVKQLLKNIIFVSDKHLKHFQEK
ncbi:MAG: hypothetical protein Q9M36_02960 [Sulfurovum sp.]|nr:hypothetical protein [Sulfurovum sp.]